MVTLEFWKDAWMPVVSLCTVLLLAFAKIFQTGIVPRDVENQPDFIPWNGTGVPVSERDRVEVIFRDGRRGGGRFFHTFEAWEHDGNDDDIVAYRILKDEVANANKR